MEIIYGTAGTILGWLLGLLSPSIINKISEKTERENLKKIIFNDLNDLKKRLAPLPFRVLPKYGKLDKENFDWIKRNSGIDFSKGLEDLFKKGKDEEQVINYLNTKGLQENTLSYFKKMHLFAIDSHLINLSLLDNDLMEKVLEIRFYVEAFNEDVDSFRKDLDLTFQPGITDNNHKIITAGLDYKSLQISGQAKYIVDKINSILEK